MKVDVKLILNGEVTGVARLHHTASALTVGLDFLLANVVPLILRQLGPQGVKFLQQSIQPLGVHEDELIFEKTI